MTTDAAPVREPRLPEQPARLDWAKLAPEVSKAMARFDQAAQEFDETELAHVIAAITVINAWNRFGVSTRMVPGHDKPGDFA